jgi:magnesium-transporting ATPase (P-type)
LSATQAAQRLARFGPNRITQRKGTPAWLRFLLQFHAPLLYILLVAALVTLLLGDYTDSSVIFAVVLVNAAIGHIQESRAARAIDALARSMKLEATVERDAQRRRVDAADLVTGDLVLLEPGDKVPADVRLLNVHDFRVDESTLTGESESVAKRPDPLPHSTVLADRRNIAYAGTLVTRGTAQAIVVATADATEVGKISQMISSTSEVQTPLTRKIASFSRLLLWLILAVAAITFVVGVARGHPVVDMFKAAVALAVGAVPEGLPAAVTIMLAVGVSRMARRRAVIRKLPAVEALGSTTVICSDKTGTLTQNQMTVQIAWVHPQTSGDHRAAKKYLFTGTGYNPAGQIRLGDSPIHRDGDNLALHEMLTCGALCGDASLLTTDGHWTIQGDPTEAALVVAARKAGLDEQTLTEQFPRVDAIPFESDRQYMATLHRRAPTTTAPSVAGRVIYVKGSVERISTLCQSALASDRSLVPFDVLAVHAAVAALAGAGLRLLAFARRDLDDDIDDLTHPMVEHAPTGLTFHGIQGMIDPPRPEAIDAVASCQHAGICIKMITGDHAITAATIARMIGIAGAGVLTGAEMAAIPDPDLPDRAHHTAVFARMTPEQKLRLVKALQCRGDVVAMTGDGVNDAPALRQADIGVAMGVAGTEVAKDAADIVLTDDNFASIQAAVEEGRSLFANLSKFLVWTLPTNVGEAFVILAAILLNWSLPILPVQALYINMITAILLGMPLIFETRDPDIMSRPPRNPREPLLTFELLMRTGLVSILLCAGAMGLFHWELARGAGQAAARTAATSVIVVGEIFYLFASRALLRPAWAVPLLSNLWLWGGILAMLATQFAFAHLPFISRPFHAAPLDALAWARVFAIGALLLVAVELEKAIRRRLAKPHRPHLVPLPPRPSQQ